MSPTDELAPRLLAQTRDFAVVTLDAEGRVRGWNPGAARIFGYAAPEIVGRAAAVLFTEEDRGREQPERDLHQARTTGRADATRWYLGKDGARVWADGSTTALRDDDGRLVGFGTLLRDVAERESAAASEHALLKRAFANSPTFLAVLRGPDHVYELVNPPLLQLVGHRDLLGRSVAEALPELAGQGFLEVLDRVYRTGQPFVGNEVPMSLVREPGGAAEERYLNFVFHPLRAPDGTVTGIVSSGFDVTELVRSRQEIERALAETERVAAERDADRRHLLTVLEQAPVAIAIIGRAGEILYRNPTFDRLWGRPAHDTSAAAYSDVYEGYHLDGRPVASHEWPGSRAVQRGEVVEGDVLEIVQAGGRRITVWINGAPVRDPEGRIVGGVVMFRDITDERRTEQQLRDAQRLHAVGTLAGGVAHEVNNALQGVLGFGSLVQRALGPRHPKAGDMAHVLQSAARAARVSQQLLAFTRQQATQTRPVPLHALTSALRPVLQQLLGADKTLVVAPPSDAPLVLADPSQVEQVLINLVANARDATETGDRVEIALEPVRLDAALAMADGAALDPGAYVCLRVTDTGHGMPPDVVSRIFDPFFTTRAVGKGSGLGLSMVYGIVKKHGGDIRVHTAPGAGTTMEVFWPVAVDAAAVDEAAPAEPVGGEAAPGGRGVVLVVDDEPLVRDLTTLVLEDEGYAVVAAADGAAALELLASGGARPDMVVTDVLMPRMNGHKLYLAAHERWPHLPFLFISGQLGGEAVLDGLVPGGAPFLQKPFTPEALAASVAELLGKAGVGRAALRRPAS